MTIDCLIRDNDLNINIVRFLGPMATTINMDGTALYEAVAALYIAQVTGKVMNIGEIILVRCEKSRLIR